MKQIKTIAKIIAMGGLTVALLSVGGCKQQQQMAQQVEQMSGQMTDSQKRLSALDSEVKKANFEIQQMKALVTKLGNVVVDLQRVEEDRAKAAEAAKAAAAAHAPKGKKPAAKHGPGPKHH